MSPRRLAYVTKIFPKLSETFIANELVELRRRGIDLRILSLLPPREEPAHHYVERAGLGELVCYEPERFSCVVEQFRPEILHAHFATESTASALELSARHHIPFTFTCHGYDIYRKPPADFSSRAAAARAVVTVSRANARHLEHRFGVPAPRIRVIPCGVDTQRFQPNGASRHLKPPLIVCVARMVAVKNLGLLLECCAQLRDRNVSFRCALVGEGPCRNELEAIRARLELEELVQMPGAAEAEQVAAYWRRAAVGLLTSSSEGMPVSLMEAAACGVPVVATAVGGVSELVEHGKTGFVVPLGEVEALVTALERLLLDRSLRERMGQAARQKAETALSVTKQVDALLGLWSDILEEDR